jgi:hypothetical protein
MSIKQFLKPDVRKIIVFLILLIISFFIKSGIALGELYWRVIGFPLPILVQTDGLFWSLSYQGIIIDLIFWYIITCLIIWIYEKFKKKPQ